jgi:hypothetical protein
MIVEVVMGIPVIAHDERSFGPSQSGHGSWRVIDGLVGSQSNEMKHIEVMQG